MRKIILVSLVLIGSSGLAIAAADIGGVQGGGFHSAIPVSEQLTYGDLKTTIQRTSVQVPEDYGKLIQITPTKGNSVLWFQNDDGVIRNVMIPNDNLWIIKRGGALDANP